VELTGNTDLGKFSIDLERVKTIEVLKKESPKK